MDEREFTAAQLRWAVFQGRNTRHDAYYVERLARAGLGLTWGSDSEEEDEDVEDDGLEDWEREWFESFSYYNSPFGN